MKLHTLSLSLLAAAAAVYFISPAQPPALDGTQSLQVMAAQQGSPTAGGFARVLRNGLQPPAPANHEYTPSAQARRLAREHMDFGQTWYSFVPDGDGPAPTVILLHGSGRFGLSMIDIWKETAQKHELILIAPNAKAKNWQPDDFSQTLLDQMLSQQALGRHTGPVYLFGHSNGAIFASMLVNRFEGPWQAAALHGGFASEQVFIPAATPKPVRLYLGERDHIFSSEEAVKTGKAMARSGHSFSLQLIPRHTHWVYEIGPRIAEDSWAWFRSLGE